MNTQLNELISDVREQVLYLQELGVETLDVKIESGKLKIENESFTRPVPDPISTNLTIEIPKKSGAASGGFATCDVADAFEFVETACNRKRSS